MQDEQVPVSNQAVAEFSARRNSFLSAVNTILDLLSRGDMEKIVNNLSARYGLSNNRMYNIDTTQHNTTQLLGT